ncbi:hypothetical protein BJ742DRAFT_830955 [Cladochytrium replicatum]|nr:hypothetical protein BJ742DRAFT_830955 [Cladochytrium replicatum]
MPTPTVPGNASSSGMNKELYALVGGMPPVMPVPTYKAKLQINKKVTKWHYTSFKNPARSDNMCLWHWDRERPTADDPTDYRFAKLNQSALVYEYTSEQYESHLQVIGWSKEETDYLIDCCKKYDLRWPVIHDRYEFSGGAARSMEDLKERYYFIATEMLKLKPSDEETKQLIEAYAYDKDREVQRKRNLELLYHRTPEQIMEEEALAYELRRRERYEKQWAMERERLVRLLGNHELPGLAGDKSSSTSAAVKKKKAPPKAEEAAGSTSTTHDVQRKKTFKAGGGEETEVEKRVNLGPPGAFLRSQKVGVQRPGTKQTVQVKLVAMLQELGIGLRPVMPTYAVSAKFEELKANVMHLLDLKKQADKLQMEVDTARARLDPANAASRDTGDAPGPARRASTISNSAGGVEEAATVNKKRKSEGSSRDSKRTRAG